MILLILVSRLSGILIDNSGDCILAVDRRQSDQLASYRFNDENDLEI